MNKYVDNDLYRSNNNKYPKGIYKEFMKLHSNKIHRRNQNQ